MHPNATFRIGDRELLEALIDEIGFGMVFAETPDGPRVAHVPLLYTGDGVLQFHLSRGNALAKHIGGMTVLTVINGPDGYVSPRWYSDQQHVPTWNYITLEVEGRVRRTDAEGLYAILHDLTERQEERVLGGTRWTMDKMDDAKLRQMLAGIVGFELEIATWRPTFKLSQNRPAEERARVAEGLEAQGLSAIAKLMRRLAE